jgi:hypothetical protein
MSQPYPSGTTDRCTKACSLPWAITMALYSLVESHMCLEDLYVLVDLPQSTVVSCGHLQQEAMHPLGHHARREVLL